MHVSTVGLIKLDHTKSGVAVFCDIVPEESVGDDEGEVVGVEVVDVRVEVVVFGADNVNVGVVGIMGVNLCGTTDIENFKAEVLDVVGSKIVEVVVVDRVFSGGMVLVVAVVLSGVIGNICLIRSADSVIVERLGEGEGKSTSMLKGRTWLHKLTFSQGVIYFRDRGRNSLPHADLV